MPPFVVFSIGVHAVGAAALVVFPAEWPLIVGAVVVDHFALVGASLWPRSRSIGSNVRRLPVSCGAGVVALTFDDGPHPEVTPEVLRILAERGARATFFCIGERAARYPEIVAEIARRGHAVENHSYRHSNAFCCMGPRAIRDDVTRAQATLTTTGGAAPRYFRAPAGLRNPWLDYVLTRQRLQLVSWTRRGFDTVSREPARILSRLTRGLAAGDVLVLHDGSSACDASGKPVVLSVLPRLLDELSHRGLRSIPLP